MTPFFVLFIATLGMIIFGSVGGALLQTGHEVIGFGSIGVAFLILFLARKAL